MNQEEILGQIDAEIDVSVSEELPFSKNWNQTYRAIEMTIAETYPAAKKEKILQKVANIINVLARYGTTYEDIVLDTAQLLIFVKETKLDVGELESAYGKVIVEAVKLLNQELDTAEKLKSVFENHQFAFIGKIKLAEYLVELAELDEKKIPENLKKEVLSVIKKYKERSHKGLMKLLIAEADKLK